MKTFDVEYQNHQLHFSIENEIRIDFFFKKSILELLKINQIILNENYHVVVDEFPQMKEREYFSSIYPEFFYPKKVISVQIISFFRKKSTTNLPENSINIQFGNSIKIKMDSNKINQSEAQIKILKQKKLKNQLDVKFKNLQIKSLEDEIETQNQKH
jgi:hypothetical protein